MTIHTASVHIVRDNEVHVVQGTAIVIRVVTLPHKAKVVQGDIERAQVQLVICAQEAGVQLELLTRQGMSICE